MQSFMYMIVISVEVFGAHSREILSVFFENWRRWLTLSAQSSRYFLGGVIIIIFRITIAKHFQIAIVSIVSIYSCDGESFQVVDVLLSTFVSDVGGFIS